MTFCLSENRLQLSALMETLPMFHVMRPLNQSEEKSVVFPERDSTTEGVTEDVLKLAHFLRMSPDPGMNSIANSLTTRALVRIAKRQARYIIPTDQYDPDSILFTFC